MDGILFLGTMVEIVDQVITLNLLQKADIGPDAAAIRDEMLHRGIAPSSPSLAGEQVG